MPEFQRQRQQRARTIQSILPVFTPGAGQIEHARCVHTGSIQKMGCRTDGDNEVLSYSFQQGGNLCHYYKQPTMWLNPCHFANKGCTEGNNCRFAHCNQEVEFAERFLIAWGHEFPHEAGALIKVYREALRVVNKIDPNP